jgi:hypothetical protein
MLRILKLPLNYPPYQVMETGEKTDEFRKPGAWIESRLYNKDGSKREYDYIEFRYGYGHKRPAFLCEFKGFEKLTESETHTYSNGLIVNAEPGDYKIFCGTIVPWTNLKS